MSCGKVEKRLSPYFDGRLSPKERQQVEAHLRECEGCRASLRLLEGVSRAMAAPGPAEPRPDLAERAFRAALAAAPAGAAVRAGGWAPARQPGGSWLDRLMPMLWPTAAASAAVAAALLVAVHTTGASPFRPAQDAALGLISTSDLGLDGLSMTRQVLGEVKE